MKYLKRFENTKWRSSGNWVTGTTPASVKWHSSRGKEESGGGKEEDSKDQELVRSSVVEFFKECESDTEFKKIIDEIETHIIRFEKKGASEQLEGAKMRKYNAFRDKARKNENFKNLGGQQSNFLDTIKKIVMGELKVEDLVTKPQLGTFGKIKKFLGF